MGTAVAYPRRVAKARYEPPNEQVASEIDEMVRLYQEMQDVEARYKAKVAACADKNGPAVPIAYLAERLGVTRKTVYRHLGQTMK
jgi:hypothetical protein